MSSADEDNVTENPQPEDETESNSHTPEGQESDVAPEGQIGKEDESEDSIEEGTEAELEAEDEVGSHQGIRPESDNHQYTARRNQRLPSEGLEEADSDSETEDHVMQSAEGASVTEGQQNRNNVRGGDNSNNCEFSSLNDQPVCDLAEADVGVLEINTNSDQGGGAMETESDRHLCENESVTRSQVICETGDQTEQSDLEGKSVEADAENACSGSTDKAGGIDLEKSENCDIEQDQCRAESEVVESGSEQEAKAPDISEEVSVALLEDEVGSVQEKGGLLARSKIQRGESGESWEPECDQDSDDTCGTVSNIQGQSCVQNVDHNISMPNNNVQIPENVRIASVQSASPPACSEVPDSSFSEGCVQGGSNNLHKNSSQSKPDTNSGSPDCVATDISHEKLSKSIPQNCSETQNKGNNSISNPSTGVCKEVSACNTDSSSLTNTRLKIDSPNRKSPIHSCDNVINKGSASQIDMVDEDLLDELESELTCVELSESSDTTLTMENDISDITQSQNTDLTSPNGLVDAGLHAKLVQQLRNLQQDLRGTKAQLQKQKVETERWKSHAEDCEDQMGTAIKERDSYLRELKMAKENSADNLYIPQIKELEFTIAQQQNDIRGLRDKLSSHDAAAKKCIAGLQTEMKHRVDQVTKMYEEANKDKADMVVKYAQAEKNFMEARKSMERLEVRVREAARERESLNNKVKDAKTERKRLQAEIDSKASEMQSMAKEMEKEKEMLVSADVRVKWAQNKLKAELEGHKDTKVLLEKTNQKLKEAKEETEQIRRNCQEIVKTYQESEEIKSNNLDNKLKMRESELQQQIQQKTSQEEMYQATCQELEQLKVRYSETLTELQTFQNKVSSLEAELRQNEETMNKFKEMLQKQKKENKDLQVRVEQLVTLQADFKRAQFTIKSLDAEISELKISNKDLKIENEACYKRETEKLELTEKLSAKNAELQSENTLLQNKSLSLSSEVQSLTVEIQSLESRVKELSHDLGEEKRLRQGEVSSLSSSLEEKSKAVEELSRRIEDEKDEIKTLKRKHVNNVKDLTRQLQQAKKRLEATETNGEKDTTSMGSRTSSNGSLNTMTDTHNGPSPSSVQNMPQVRHYSPQEHEYPVITEQVEPDRQLLIERIVKLQRSHARKNEKIEFMDDHISQLIDEIRKKNRIIQSYALREESGTLTPEAMDVHKIDSRRQSLQAQFTKKHSIMGSLYSSHQTDGTMTLDLSLEINKKLQAVLEDTLLKNITLKESLDTLGGEISRLSQENRQLQLASQGKKKPAR